MEEWVLTSPVVQSKTTVKYRVVSCTLDLEAVVSPGAGAGLVAVQLRSDLNEPLYHTYTGAVATTLIKQLNVANLATKSLHKRIIERLTADGILPPGAITGTPD